MSLRPITQAKWDEWCARPGTDAFGRPWSSWEADVSDERAALYEQALRLRNAPPVRTRHVAEPAGAGTSSQLELSL